MSEQNVATTPPSISAQRATSNLAQFNRMHPIRWVPADATSVLDVGCNVGSFLQHCREVFPGIRVAGIEPNPDAWSAAVRNLPGAELYQGGAEALPFASESFDCATCIEVLEHVPQELRARSFLEMQRVLKPGGRLVVRVPHAGLFAFLDPGNLRFRLPGLYRFVVGRGLRDKGYEAVASHVVWHHHFKKQELLELAGGGWQVEAWRRGGLFLMPLMDAARWPFYRKGRANHPICRLMERIAAFDIGCPYGAASYDILMVLRRA
jgi:SAM-dependent methyltransferase